MPTYTATPLTPQQMQVAYGTPGIVPVDTTGTYDYGGLTPPAPIDASGNFVDLTNAPATPAAGQSPAGSVLIYQASWSGGFLKAAANVAIGAFGGGGQVAIADLQSSLPASQGAISNGNVITNGPLNFSISVTVTDNSGHALISDLQSVLDALLTQAVGAPVTSSLSMLKIGSGQPGGSNQFLTWLQTNWQWALLGSAGAFVAWKVLK
jgi:hypothetical protein